MKISKGKYVELHYMLTFDSFEGEIIEETSLEEPMQVEIGAGDLLPAFESQIEGLQVGDEFRFKIPVEQAFGDYDESNLLEVEKSALVADNGQKMPDFQEGEVVLLTDDEGEEVPVEIVEVRDKSIIVDANHPLAGEDLYFQGKILAVEGAIN